jgi:hypothetical protein
VGIGVGVGSSGGGGGGASSSSGDNTPEASVARVMVLETLSYDDVTNFDDLQDAIIDQLGALGVNNITDVEFAQGSVIVTVYMHPSGAHNFNALLAAGSISIVYNSQTYAATQEPPRRFVETLVYLDNNDCSGEPNLLSIYELGLCDVVWYNSNGYATYTIPDGELGTNQCGLNDTLFSVSAHSQSPTCSNMPTSLVTGAKLGECRGPAPFTTTGSSRTVCSRGCDGGVSYAYLSTYSDTENCLTDLESELILKDQVCVALRDAAEGEPQSVMLDMPSSACRERSGATLTYYADSACQSVKFTRQHQRLGECRDGFRLTCVCDNAAPSTSSTPFSTTFAPQTTPTDFPADTSGGFIEQRFYAESGSCEDYPSALQLFPLAQCAPVDTEYLTSAVLSSLDGEPATCVGDSTVTASVYESPDSETYICDSDPFFNTTIPLGACINEGDGSSFQTYCTKGCDGPAAGDYAWVVQYKTGSNCVGDAKERILLRAGVCLTLPGDDAGSIVMPNGGCTPGGDVSVQYSPGPSCHKPYSTFSAVEGSCGLEHDFTIVCACDDATGQLRPSPKLAPPTSLFETRIYWDNACTGAPKELFFAQNDECTEALGSVGESIRFTGFRDSDFCNKDEDVDVKFYTDEGCGTLDTQKSDDGPLDECFEFESEWVKITCSQGCAEEDAEYVYISTNANEVCNDTYDSRVLFKVGECFAHDQAREFSVIIQPFADGCAADSGLTYHTFANRDCSGNPTVVEAVVDQCVNGIRPSCACNGTATLPPPPYQPAP